MDTSDAAAPEEDNARAQVDGTPAFRRCLEAVRLNDTCFASWSLLVAEAERSQNPLLGDVYERLLAAFPPCTATGPRPRGTRKKSKTR